MNLQKLYIQMQQPIEPSPELIHRSLDASRRRPKLLRQLIAAGIAAAVLLATPALAVRTEAGYQLLYQISPPAAQFFHPVQKSCTDQGVTMEVAGVRVAGDTAQAWITLTGAAVDETTDLFDSWSFHLPFDQDGHCERVGWDEESKTVTFLCTTKTMDGSPIPVGGKMTFSVHQLLTGKETLENTPVELNLSEYAVQAETAPSWNDSSERTDGSFYRSGGSYSGDTGEALCESAPILRPGAPLAAPTDGITITAAGYAGDLFHIQVCWGNILEHDNHGRLWLVDQAGNQIQSVCAIGFQTVSEETQNRIDYTDFLFDLSPEDLGTYTLRGDFCSTSALTEGLWRVIFPLENT